MNELTLISTLLGMLLASLILVTTFFTSKNKNAQLYDSLDRSSPIDAMRGILALSVMTHHFYITYVWKTVGSWKTPESIFLENLGAVGVSLFFLTTGFLFLNKIKKNNINWKSLYISRFRRILPLFFLAATIVILITFISIDRPVYNYESLKFIFKWLIFRGGSIDSFESNRIIAGVHWSLLYEWGFYFTLPFIYMLFNKKIPSKLLLVLCSIPIIYILTITDKKLYVLFFLSYISIFFKDQIKKLIKNHQNYCNAIILSILTYALFFTHGYSLIQQLLLSIVFSFIANGLNLFILSNKGLKVLGDISYSIYNFMLYYPIVFVITIFISLFTHKFIEKKFQRQ